MVTMILKTYYNNIVFFYGKQKNLAVKYTSSRPNSFLFFIKYTTITANFFIILYGTRIANRNMTRVVILFTQRPCFGNVKI